MFNDVISAALTPDAQMSKLYINIMRDIKTSIRSTGRLTYVSDC